MKDSLKTALLKIDQLQHQVDSLKTLNTNKIEVLQSQLEQSNNTVSNLGSLSTAWGTTYAVSAIVVSFLTIALAIATFAIPRWLKKKSKKAIVKLQTDFDSKFLDLKTAYDRDIKGINEKFEQKYSDLSEANSLQLQELQSTFSQATNKLKEDIDNETIRIESNLWAFRSQIGEADEEYGLASTYSLIAAAGHEQRKGSVQTVLSNLINSSRCFKYVTSVDLKRVNGTLLKFSIKGTIDDYIKFFEESPNAGHYMPQINEIKEHLKTIS